MKINNVTLNQNYNMDWFNIFIFICDIALGKLICYILNYDDIATLLLT